MVKVLKLDGRKQEFNKYKITSAIIKAMRSLNIEDDDFAIESANDIYINNKLKEVVSVSDIHNQVEDLLLKSKYKDVGKEYVHYRRKRNEERSINSPFMKMIKKTMELQNIENENANTNEYVFSSRNNRVSDKLVKAYASAKLLRPEVRKAFEDNYIYIHDFNNYASGMHNCTNLDLADVLKGGFYTNNSPIREPQSISSAMQLTAVILQCQSNLQFGGIAVGTIDFDLAPYVNKSFVKHFKDGLKYLFNFKQEAIDEFDYGDIKFEETKNEYNNKSCSKALKYAWDQTVKEAKQGAEALIHNLNSLQSRSSDQLPFTSLNYGMDTSPEGRLVTRSLLKATLDGVGTNLVPIFPIQIFQYYKGINDKPGTPNYDLFQLAVECTSKRIYPNYANASASYFKKPTCKQEIFSTMGCRTQTGEDRFGMIGIQKRGNISPITINLAKIGIENGICLGKRNKPDLEGFWKDLDRILEIGVISLVDRFNYQAKQPAKSAPFCYENGILGEKLNPDESVYKALRHGTLAIGLVGIANCCLALFGKHHFEDEKVYEFAYEIYKRFDQKKKEASEKYDLNFSLYSSPCESSCYTMNERLINEFGEIPNVIDRGYLTNSFHCPVWYSISAEDKINGESKFHELSRGGAISYVELDGSAKHNHEAIEKLINHAMEKDISYFAINIKIDTCKDCHYQDIIDDKCPKCGSENIQRLRRITGYLAGDYETQFNNGKKREVEDRIVHVNGNILFNGESE